MNRNRMSKSVKREAARLGVNIVAQELISELNRLIEKRRRAPRRWWVKPWVARRGRLGASSTILKEWRSEDSDQYRNHLRMTESQFTFLLERLSPHIQKQDTWFRDALAAQIKTEMTLRYLATGDSPATLGALYRVPRNTFSSFLPEVCEAMYTVLEEYIKVSSGVLRWCAARGGTWKFPNVPPPLTQIEQERQPKNGYRRQKMPPPRVLKDLLKSAARGGTQTSNSCSSSRLLSTIRCSLSTALLMLGSEDPLEVLFLFLPALSVDGVCVVGCGSAAVSVPKGAASSSGMSWIPSSSVCVQI